MKNLIPHQWSLPVFDCKVFSPAARHDPEKTSDPLVRSCHMTGSEHKPSWSPSVDHHVHLGIESIHWLKLDLGL